MPNSNPTDCPFSEDLITLGQVASKWNSQRRRQIVGVILITSHLRPHLSFCLLSIEDVVKSGLWNLPFVPFVTLAFPPQNSNGVLFFRLFF
ncbi:hypothetical protein EPI10_015899 [Gossypium australe]|uniref:Uncharacterized protein n=1 Tax=Gossypium australe TaxID=47621 RepID=A0A5B6VLL7_9ROSI|nr:hypothetical protein EPI10_015899 [Gossypium australe]